MRFTLSSILDYEQVVLLGDGADGVHLAGDACIVHAADGPGALSDCCLDARLVDVQRVSAHVDEHRHHSSQHQRIGGGRKSVRRKNHL